MNSLDTGVNGALAQLSGLTLPVHLLGARTERLSCLRLGHQRLASELVNDKFRMNRFGR